MSLLNLIVHPETAYIITDSGHYDVARGGVVTRLGPKSMVVEEQQVVIACAGRLQCAFIAKGVMERRHMSQAELVADLPYIAKEAIERFKIDLQSTVVFAGYSKERGCAFGGAFLTHAVGSRWDNPRPELEYKILDRKALLLPSVPDASLSDLMACNPMTDLLPIIERQRRFDFGSPGHDVGCCIAGDIDVVSIGASGFGIKTIHTYPAAIGERVAV